MVKSTSGKEDEYPLPPYRAAFVGLNPMCRRHLKETEEGENTRRTRLEHTQVVSAHKRGSVRSLRICAVRAQCEHASVHVETAGLVRGLVAAGEPVALLLAPPLLI